MIKSVLYRFVLSGLLCMLFIAGCDSSDPNVVEEEIPIQASRSIEVSINTSEGRQAISPYIYGSNQELSSTDAFTVRRIGGNRLTGYNWENDYSNAGEDWMHSSDIFLLNNSGLTESSSQSAVVMTNFHDQSIAMGAESIITLQMAGYVAADKNGNVSAGQTAPSFRWKQVAFTKDAPFDAQPDRTDDTVYMDEFVQFMVNRYGSAASETGVQWYSLDNEPGLWASTHPRIHPEPLKVTDLVDRSIELALAVKAVDPDAKIVGPALYGFAAYETLQGAPDWEQERTGKWFIEYYLEKMREAEQTHGIRLLDVLDVHWYPEARGDNRITLNDGSETTNDALARLQAPRTLWDASYVEDSWIGQWKQAFLPIIPTLQESIESYYPGTKLGITEYNYGAGNSISGGLAQVDVLGVFGTSGIHLATLWRLNGEHRYTSSAFTLYRDYDGQGSVYGNTAVQVDLADKETFSVYASIHDDNDEQLHIMVVNKHMEDATAFTFTTESSSSYSEADIWFFDQRSPLVQQASSQSISGETFNYTVPAQTAMHFVLK